MNYIFALTAVLYYMRTCKAVNCHGRKLPRQISAVAVFCRGRKLSWKIVIIIRRTMVLNWWWQLTVITAVPLPMITTEKKSKVLTLKSSQELFLHVYCLAPRVCFNRVFVLAIGSLPSGMSIGTRDMLKDMIFTYQPIHQNKIIEFSNKI